jgi:hypothetical protein
MSGGTPAHVSRDPDSKTLVYWYIDTPFRPRKVTESETFWFMFWRCLVLISTGTPAVPIEASHGFLLALLEHAE